MKSVTVHIKVRLQIPCTFHFGGCFAFLVQLIFEGHRIRMVQTGKWIRKNVTRMIHTC